MGSEGKKGREHEAAASAANTESQGDSQACRSGRRLSLWFVDVAKPQLHRVEFLYSNASKLRSYEQGDDPHFAWTPVPQGLSLFCLDYIYHNSRFPQYEFRFRAPSGTPAGALRNSKYTDSSFVHDLFVELPLTGGRIEHFKDAFSAPNVGGSKDADRYVTVDPDFLPADCIEVYWKVLGEKPLTDPGDIKRLADQIRVALKLPVPTETDALRGPLLSKEPLVHKPRPPVVDPAAAKNASPKMDAAAGEFAFEFKTGSSPEAEAVAPEPPLPPIDPSLFTVKENALFWPDDMPLIEWDQEDDSHNWKLKNAFEGVLIMGATGSGKSTGSGATIAETFLRSGFGGLIMTVKSDEAERWRRLCVHCGREGDFVTVQRGGDWKLNVLAYQAQRPGPGAGLSENLTSFCRNLLRISTRSQGTGTSDPVWKEAGDQLLNATFDVFLLAGGGITFDRLANFVASAPTEKFPANEDGWLKIPVFGEVFAKAKSAASSPEDKRLFGKAKDYWFKVYPGYASRTRTSVTLGIFAMFDAFRGRDIPALISSGTNITPESIMSGKIVVLDLPLKELEHTGLMVQSAWKYLFQTALERHARAGNPHRRPVFLWEDEGQHFFSEHDHHFQATARSSRVCHVVLSQNVHNFYKEFGRGGAEAANSFFANLNTKIFHANSSPVTNEWAARHFGHELRPKVTISHNPPPPKAQSESMFDNLMAAWNPPSTAGISTTEQWEYVVRPEEFNRLRVGGPENDFQVDAFVTWIGTSGNERHFTHITFNQNQNL